jgi:molecular chaperone GrpE
MNVLKEYKGYQLVERYDKTYIRFWGGREEDMPCEFPISKTDAERVINEASVIDELLSIAKTQIEWTANSFYKIGIAEYILHHMKLSQTRAEKSYEKIARYADIRKEFYQYIMDDEVFTPNPIKVEGFTAQHLATNYPLSALGAYNYLIYLREMPEKALADLKAGLPTRDSSKIEAIINQEEVQKTMDEKNVTPVEGAEQVTEVPNEAEVPQSELLAKLDAVQQALATLQQSFDDKIAEDTHKNGLFDNMHRELVRYQNGALDKIVDTIALDIIQLVDTTKGHVRVYEKKEPTEENYKKLIRIVKGIAEDLEDILYRQNIESYRVPGHEVDTRRQKIIQTMPTDDKSKDNLVAVRAADGYEKGDKVLRPERIKIFKYEASSETPSEN